MNTPLQHIKPHNGTLTLSRADLGDLATVSIHKALKLNGKLSLINCTMPVPPTANLLIVEGTLSAILKHGKATLRLYIFEVATTLYTTERHALILFKKLPQHLTATKLLKPFCTTGETGETIPAEVSALKTLSFASTTPLLLFSSLPYKSSLYVKPPFPPKKDPALSKEEQNFIKNIQKELTEGYLFEATATLQSSITIPVPADASPHTQPIKLDLSTLLKTLHLGDLCTKKFSITAQLAFTQGRTQLNLFHLLASSVSPSKIPLKPSITAVGIGLQLGSGKVQIPSFLLQGTLTLASKPSEVDIDFNPYTEQLQVSFSHLPDFTDLAHNFGSGTSLKSILGNNLPKGVLSSLGTLDIVSLNLTIDLNGLSVSALSFSIITEHALPLFEGISLQPALIVSFTDPFKSYRTVNVDVVGKWFLKSSSLETILMVKRVQPPSQDSTTFIANLSLGSGVNLIEVAEELFHKQIAGLPSLTLADIELLAQRSGSGTKASDSINIQLDVSSGWNLDGIDIEIEDLSLVLGFAKKSPKAKWEVDEVTAQGTLEIGPVFFYLDADYDAGDKSWTFSGGTLPGETIKLGDFFKAITKELKLNSPPDFLEPFKDVEVTGCYLEYQTSKVASSNWKITVSTDFKSGKGFHSIVLDEIVISFGREGTGTSFSFDATAPSSSSNTLSHSPQKIIALTDYLKSKFHLSVDLPSALTDDDILLKGLSASFNSSTNNYSFMAYLNFGHNALVQLSIDVISHTLNGKTTKDYNLGGALIFNPGDEDEFKFNLNLGKSGAAIDLVATLQSSTTSPGIKLNKLVHAIDSSVKGLDDFEIDIKNALFAHSGKHGISSAKSLFAIDMGAQVNLSKLGKLPLIGHELASASSLDLAFQVVYATGHYKETEVQDINQMLDDPSFQFPEADIKPHKPSLSTSIRNGSQGIIDMDVPVTATGQGTLSPTGSHNIRTRYPKASTTGSEKGVTWFSLNKAFGPLRINRIGLAFDKKAVSVKGYLDGAVTVGPLSFDLLGLNVGVPLTGADKFKPTFGLQGLGLEYQVGPTQIGGTLFKGKSGDLTVYDGFVTLGTEALEIGAVGSFAQMDDGHDSLFVYAVLAEPLGGPSFFFVTGLAAGFGYNRKLLPPPLSQVEYFPLVAQAIAPLPEPQTGDLGGVRNYIAQELRLMQRTIVPTEGEYFLAAGIKFTSFELIDGFLLAVVQFGNEFRIDLLGLANALLPPDDTVEPLAEAQLAVLAHFVPSEGSIWVQGQLTPNSFILSRNCHLTGGFALACWVSGPHEGKFVVTIGGYAKRFQVPKYYPHPPRVGFNWLVNYNLNVKGGGYFALVPHALMAGGDLHALWQSNDVKAWFVMGAHFLIAWKPFHYAADIYVDLGAKLTIHFFGTHHVSIDASADLKVWGPPFGGHARISVHVIGTHFHFNIDFGSSSTTPPPLKWKAFQKSFLPANDKHWLGVNIKKGLLRTVKGTLGDGSTEVDVWVVKRDELHLVTSSVFPIKSATFKLDGKTASAPAIKPTTPGIAPMDVKTIDTSEHSISITKVKSKGSSRIVTTTKTPNEQLKLVANTKKIPSAMWGHSRTRPLNPTPGEDVLDSVSGFSVVPTKEASDDPAAITKNKASLAYETTQHNGFKWISGTGTFKGETTKWSDVAKAIQTTQKKRTAALHKMGFKKFKENFNQPLEREAPIDPKLGTWKS